MNTIFPNALEVSRHLPRDKKITLVGGCFDLIHVGHLHLFEYASSLEDLLVVAVLTDTYSSKNRKRDRPIINEMDRAKMVASIRFVDFVYLSNISPSSKETLELLRPSSVVFDKESVNSEQMIIREKNLSLVSPYTKIKYLSRYKDGGTSTTAIINRIRNT